MPCAVLATCSNLHSGHKSRARCTAGSSLAHVPAAGTAYLCIHFLKSLKAWRNLVVQMTFKPSQPKLCYDYKGPSNAMVPREAPVAHTHPRGRAGNERTWLGLQHCWGYSGPGLGKGTHARKSLATLLKLCPVLAKIPIVTYSSGLTGDINILPLPEELCFLVQLYPGKSRSHLPGRKQVAGKPRARLTEQLPQ